MRHGVYVTEQATSVATPLGAESGVPFVVGLAPVHRADSPAKPGVPVLCTSWSEAVEKLGYSDNWEKYTLCEFMYSHFKLFTCQPVIFCNVLDVSKTEAVEASDMTVVGHKVTLPMEAVDSSVVINSTDGVVLENGTDYATYYDGENLIIELLTDGSAYTSQTINVSYSQVVVDATAADIAVGIESAELCLTLLGTTPDLICVPGWSHDPAIAAAMVAKAGNINGLFHAKALIDIDCGSDGTATYTAALAAKSAQKMTDPDQIVCWPMLTLGDRRFHMSTQIAGLMAEVDTRNDGCPYESPSNKNLHCDGLCLANGSEVTLTFTQANQLNASGIMTALNFVNGWVAWGNYTGCYPENKEAKDSIIPISRMFAWAGNTLIKTFWSKLDKPMNRRLIDTVLDAANIWLNGVVGKGYLLGARVAMYDDENTLTNLMAGIIKLHIYMTPPGPAQEIDFVLEYDSSYVSNALQS